MRRIRLLIWVVAIAAVLRVAFSSLPVTEPKISRALLGESPLPMEQGESFSFDFTLPYKASITLSIVPVRQLFWPDLKHVRSECQHLAAEQFTQPDLISLESLEPESKLILFDEHQTLTQFGRLSLNLQIETLSESCISRHRYGSPTITVSQGNGEILGAFLYEQFGPMTQRKIPLSTFNAHQRLQFEIRQEASNKGDMAPRTAYQHFIHLHRVE